MRGRNDIFYWQLLSTSTPFSSTEGLAKGTPFKDSGPCLPSSLSVVSDCRSPVPGVSEPGSPALCPVTAAAEPMVGWHLWLRPPWTTVLYQWNISGYKDIPGPEQLEVWASLSVENSSGLS